MGFRPCLCEGELVKTETLIRCDQPYPPSRGAETLGLGLVGVSALVCSRNPCRPREARELPPLWKGSGGDLIIDRGNPRYRSALAGGETVTGSGATYFSDGESNGRSFNRLTRAVKTPGMGLEMQVTRNSCLPCSLTSSTDGEPGDVS